MTKFGYYLVLDFNIASHYNLFHLPTMTHATLGLAPQGLAHLIMNLAHPGNHQTSHNLNCLAHRMLEVYSDRIHW